MLKKYKTNCDVHPNDLAGLVLFKFSNLLVVSDRNEFHQALEFMSKFG